MIEDVWVSGAVRAAVVLAIGLIAYASVARAAAATRRLILAVTLGAAIIVPVAAAVGPRWTVEAPAALPVLAHESANEAASIAGAAGGSIDRARAASSQVAAASAHGGFDATRAIVLAWLAIAAALLARATASQLRARAIVQRATPIDRAALELDAIDARHVGVRASRELDSPVVIGLVRPTIVVPHAALAWPRERWRVVLVHELAHVRRRDVLVQALAEVACAIHWCNPLAWICARRLRVECELAADDAVLAAGVRPSRYAEELVAVATSIAAPRAALAMAERSSLEARVVAILAVRVARAPLAAWATIAIVAAGTVVASAVAWASPQHAATTTTTTTRTARVGTDPAIQRAADDELAAITAAWSPELATIIVLDPATGEVLANAGHSAIAIVPGSTLKPITIAAALERHAITVDQTFACGPEPRVYGDRTVRDSSVNGTLDVAHLLAVSSNIGTSRIFDALGGDALGDWLHRFHFDGVPAHIATGSYDGAEVAIGAGLTATPLEMIAAYGAIADDGVYHAPAFDRGGSPAERVVSPETARAVMALLRTAVVDDTATGKAARVDGVRVAGKTGTAAWTAPDGRDRTYASFIGVADLPARRIVALVGIQAARGDMSGGAAAAPVFARLVARLR